MPEQVGTVDQFTWQKISEGSYLTALIKEIYFSYLITTVPVGQSTSSTPGLQQSLMQSVGVPLGVGHSVGCSFFVNSSVVHTSS